MTLDGSVLLTHGGIEMGQGLHTKMIQVASRTLDINPELIHINEVSTWAGAGYRDISSCANHAHFSEGSIHKSQFAKLFHVC